MSSLLAQRHKLLFRAKVIIYIGKMPALYDSEISCLIKSYDGQNHWITPKWGSNRNRYDGWWQPHYFITFLLANWDMEL